MTRLEPNLETPSVVIFMATYNGSRYLRQQIESLQAQTLRSWRLHVRDDGSADDTPRILEQFAASDPRIRIASGTEGNLGPAANFVHLLKTYDGESPYFAFADQDDIWDSRKLELMLRVLENENAPALAYSNAKILQSETVTRRVLLWYRPIALNELLFLNGGVQGCLMVFNRQLLAILREYEGKYVMHDHLALLAAGTFGRLLPVNNCLVYYRKHEENYTLSLETRVWEKLTGFFSLRRPVLFDDHLEATTSFANYHSEKLSPVTRALFNELLRFSHERSRLRRLLIVSKNQFRLGSNNFALMLKVAIRPAVGPRSMSIRQ